ncbi:hypothetical protein KOW79_012212 [Hemibagrus wyckioides]|uniref:Coiled-coil domain-containing protein 146 n=2 Tax=Hemibagrus wyckioides TaxID=337641 RepID=A0A9D3NKC2_9TELE|nr:coiled-coil domain-containing protein 146 isoform X2 [Hemibagrus wyckioides]XP_058263374.1 coiled-coil domain-containing protein 146 isoform X2 [Hemibagrus wyckioides]XP_058263375.1 coiled-coil domain-containing protein 146 isoform X2 [Hemibagrus wyckioides]XP_058263376.1 coiled-coil domain-containing protein 146 isoform X2 [Hemibagrus wyckioides]XP_058263377.1 coiled-coil domain-containing protein 146 isoform X2 [Hemibagrus wyckioides]KAG7324196.1 hypothetical protein KOW79_012212 [Hemibag
MSQPDGSSTPPPGGDENKSHFQPEKLQEVCTNSPSTSLALQCLEELFLDDVISGDKMARLKASLNLLHDTLRSSQESELKLLQEVQCLQAELKRQQQELQKAELFSEGQRLDGSCMRQQLLQFHNKLQESEERERQMQYKLACLQEEKICLKKEYESQPKYEQEKRSIALNESSEKMKKEITQRHQEIKTLTDGIKACNTQLQKEQQELEDKKDTIQSKEAELAQLLSIPAQLGKEIGRINCKMKNVQKQKTALERQLLELAERVKQTQVGCRQLDEECRSVMKELKGCRAQLEVAQRERSMLLKEQEMTKEEEAVLLEQRGLLEINLIQIKEERKTLHDSLVKKVREKDRLQRRLKNMLLQHKMSKDALLHTQELYNKTKTQRDIMPKDDDLLQKIQDLQTEVDNLKLKVVHQQSVTGIEAELVEQCIVQKQALVRECNHHRGELHHLHALIRIKADERDQKSRELLKAQMRCNQIKQDIRGKQLQILEHKKQYQEIQSRLCVFGKLYETTKEERNKCVNLLQIVTQHTTKMKEKFKILKNEIEILHSQTIKNDRLLQKSHLKHVHSHTIWNSLRNDISKVTGRLHEMQHKSEEQRLKIVTLGQVINAQEQDLLHMRKSHDASVQSRNERGVQLLEREEEMCVFYAKVNVQKNLICEGTLQIQALEEESCSLKMLINEEQRQINLSKKQMSCKKPLEDESASLQIQLSECKEHNLSLEKTLEVQVTERRLRKLSGEDPSPPELIKKIEQLEMQLAAREAQLLEKELIYEQVNRLSQHIRTKADNGKEDTLRLAKKVNEFQSRIKECTKKLMAVVSELAMRQSQALCLQQELREKEFELDLCHSRLEMGLGPSETIEQEWLCHIQTQQKCQITEEEEWSQLPNGVYTTADLRPNSYIPTEDSLPLPKPYGALAPFKPSELGTNMRHIRKPQPKPLEI